MRETSSELGTVETDEERLSIICSEESTKAQKAESRIIGGLATCPDKLQQRVENHNRYTTAHLGPLDHVDQEKKMLQSWQSFQQCCGSVFWNQRKRDEPRW